MANKDNKDIIPFAHKRILSRLSNPNENELGKTIYQITNSIFRIFSNHIGKDNSISSYDLFKGVFDLSPDEVDVFQRSYLWSILKTLLQNFRSTGELFVNNLGSRLYVIQTRDEAETYKARIDRTIKSMEESKKRVDLWVRTRKWKTILNSRRLLK